MRHRSPARWLAPVALVSCALATYVVVQSTLSDSGGSPTVSAPVASTDTTTSTTPAASTTSTIPRRPASSATPATYTVRPGDVLSAIAEKTGVSVDRLMQLNPAADATGLQPGQKLRLR